MSSSSMIGVRTKPKAGFWFIVQKCSVPESSGASLAKKPHLDFKPDSHQSGMKSAGGYVLVSLTLAEGN